MMIASVTRLLSYVINWLISPPSSLSSTGHCKPSHRAPPSLHWKTGGSSIRPAISDQIQPSMLFWSRPGLVFWSLLMISRLSSPHIGRDTTHQVGQDLQSTALLGNKISHQKNLQKVPFQENFFMTPLSRICHWEMEYSKYGDGNVLVISSTLSSSTRHQLR